VPDVKLMLVLALCATAAAEPRQPERVPSLPGLEAPPSIAYIMRPPAVDIGMAIAPPSMACAGSRRCSIDPQILLGGMPDLLSQVTDALFRAVSWLVPTAT